jgi:tetratricopeptide (TPR) repeat protein
MKIRQFIPVLAILLLVFVFVQPVMTAENRTEDAATKFYNIGVNLLEEKEYIRAIAAFDQALASNTTMIRMSDGLLYLYQNKAFALIQLNNYTEAIQTIDQGLSLYPNDEKLWYNKGYVSFRLGQYQDAITAYDKVIQINNQSVPALNNKADTYFQMGRYQDAVDTYSRANAIEPNDSYSLAGLTKAKSAAATANQTTLVILVIILAVAAGVLVYYIKNRKPAEQKKPERKSEGTKRKKK